MKKFITHIGMDTDSRGFDIAIAEGFGSNNSEVRSWGRIPATLAAVDKLIKQLRKPGVERSETPGPVVEKIQSPRSGR